jgi:ribose-phosphate pyrophosphokinase
MAEGNMKGKSFDRGPIQLYALPGTEQYVKKIANWLISDLKKQISENNLNISEYLLMDEEEEKILKYSTDEECLMDYLLGDFIYYSHRNGAIEISINKSARRRDIYLFHTFSEADVLDRNNKPRHITFSDQEVLLYNTLDAFLEAKVNRVNIFEMNLGQARSDVPKGRGASNLRTFFRNITANGADHLFIFQIHSNKSLIGIDNTRTTYDNLSGQSLLKKYILRAHVKNLDYFYNTVQKDWLFSSSDAGGKEFALKFSKSFNTPLLVVDKRRNPHTNVIEEITILKPESLAIKDKIVYIVDDMIDSGGSIDGVCRKYKELGAKEVNVAAFYGIFSPPAEERINQLRKEGALNKLIITDLISHSDEFLKRNPFIEIVDTTYTVSRIISRTNQGKSLEKYFLPLIAEKYLKEKVELNFLQKNIK